MAATYGEGIYTAPATDATYTSLVARARLLLGLGQSVVLDATWSSARHRALAADVAAATSSVLFELRCDAPAAVREHRVAERARSGGDVSDASPMIFRAVAEAEDAWRTATTVDTTGSVSATLSAGLTAHGVT
jgi:predicted kinase